MPYGYNGRILRVDLTAGTTEVEQPAESFYRRYLGGGALALYYLVKEMKPGAEALGPENILVFAASAVTGTPVMGLSRFSVAAKSPMTGGFGESEAGGWWGPELKFAGFDAVIVKGRSDTPVYLYVHNGEAELMDASHLWGQRARETQDMIRSELGDEKIRVALIGPAGENLVRYANIVNELRHANGRTGLGAVMGAKNLKAVAVRGNRRMKLHDAAAVREIKRKIMDSYRKDPGLAGVYNQWGTAVFVSPLNNLGMLPTRNFASGSFEEADALSGESLNSLLAGKGTCHGCPVRCKREVKLDRPYKVDPIYGGPEYETVAAFGSLCGIGDLGAVAMANQLCGAYTLDTISTGTTIAFAMECFERGLITLEDTGGIRLEFGNAEAMLQMVELIAKREGFGNLLAEGVKVAAEKIGQGASKYAMHVKGLPLPLHEPRGKTGLALAYALSPTGADHLEAAADSNFESEAGLQAFLPLGIPCETVSSMDFGFRKVRLFAYLQWLFNMYNSIGICLFTTKGFKGPISMNQLVDYVNAVTGWETNLWEMMKVGERHGNLARVFNLREGLTSKDDTLPDRLFRPLEGGALKGKKIDRKELREALGVYYEMVGWDQKGRPLRAKLQELGLEWACLGQGLS